MSPPRYNDIAKQVGQVAQQAGNLPLDQPDQPRAHRTPSPTVLAFWARMTRPPEQAMEYGIFPPHHRRREPGDDDDQ
jgi:hypothetical protein